MNPEDPTPSAQPSSAAESFAFEAPTPPPRRRLMPILVSLGVVAALVVASLAYLFTRGAGPALAMTYREGEHYRYQLTMGMDVRMSSPQLGGDLPINGQISAVMDLEVTDVDSKGVATLRMTMEDMEATFDGQTETVPSGTTMTIRITPDGRILTPTGLGFGAGGSSGLSMPGMDQFTPLLPDGDAEPGDTWTKEFDIPNPFGDGSMRYDVEGSFLRYEQVNGVQAAVIENRIRVPLDMTFELSRMAELMGGGLGSDFPAGIEGKIVYDGLMEFDGTTWFDREAGQPIRNVMSGTMDVTMRFEGFPASQGVPNGEARMAGDFTMEVTNLLA